MDPALIQQIMGAAPLQEQQSGVDQQIADILARRRAYQPQRHTSGLGALLGGIGDYLKVNGMNEQEADLRAQHSDLAKRQADLRQAYANAIMGAAQPVQAPPDLIAAPGFDQASQERNQQRDVGQMATLGELSGDPTMAKVGYETLTRAQQAPKLALETQQARKAQQESDALDTPQAGDAMRALLGKYGLETPEGTPGATLRALLPTAEKGFAASESAAARREAAAQSAQLRQMLMQTQQNKFDVTTSMKEDQFKAKRLKELTDSLNPFIRKGGLANYAQGINRAGKLDALLVDPQTGQPKQLLTPQDMVETAIALQQLVAAGHASQSEVEQLVPKSIGSDVARGLQYFTGKPWDSGQQAWALRMLHTAHREADINRGSIVQALKQQIPQFGDVRSKWQPDYESILKGAGINPAAFNEQGLPVEGMDMGLGTNPNVGGTTGGGEQIPEFKRVNGKLVRVK